jgi:archaellum component FlaC
MLYHLTEENKMISKEQIDRVVNAIEEVGSIIEKEANPKSDSGDRVADSLANIAFSLDELQDTMKSILTAIKNMNS